MRHFGTLVGLALLLASPTYAFAQTSNTTNSAQLPNLAIPEKDLGDDRKFFLFHKPGVTFELARADLGFCWQFLPRGLQRKVPGFVPWRRPDAPREMDPASNYYGMVGAVMLAIIAGPLERSARQLRMFRCMVPRGYARYRTSESLWKQLNSEDAKQSIQRQAKIASGPVPPTPRVLP